MLLSLICTLLLSSVTGAAVRKAVFNVPSYNTLPNEINIQSEELNLNSTLTLNGYDYSILKTTVRFISPSDTIDLPPIHGLGYSDINTGSSVVASREGDCVRFHGLIREGETLRIFKIRPEKTICDTSSEFSDGQNSGTPHFIEAVDVSPPNIDKDIKDFVETSTESETDTKFERARAGPGQFEDYHIESRVYTDSTMYEEFLKFNGQDRNRALAALRLYVVAQMNQVDTVYKNIDTNANRFRVSVWLKSLVIITSRNDPLQQRIYQNAIPGGIQSTFSRTYVDDNQMLSNLGAFSSEQPWSDYDYLFWITKYNLAQMRNGQLVSDSVLGLAPLAERSTGICRNDNRQTIIEDDLNTWSTMAHELGHTLGCTHDGTGSNTCRADQSYIMTAVGGSGDLNTLANRYRWSQCSINEMKAILSGLNQDGYERVCLYNRPCTHAGLGGVSPNTDFPDVPGYLTPEDQCRRITDGERGLCAFSQSNDPKLCGQLLCAVSNTNCNVYTPGLLPGSPCGTGNNWCQNGVCVPKTTKAPVACSTTNLDTNVKSSCQRTDDSNVLAPFGNLRCPQYVQRNPEHCMTQSSVASTCCFSCQSNGWQAQATNVLSFTTNNFCNPNPCRSGGQCNSLSNGFQCSCPTGYSGSTCENFVCSPNPCVRGTCSPTNNGFSCTCETGWSGLRCDQQSSNCPSSNICNNGRCISESNGYRCECNVGWQGQFCNQQINFCVGHRCVNGDCQSVTNGYRCNCNTGWAGTFCDQRTSNCPAGNVCNNGRCESEVNGFRCICDSGWGGRYCNETLNTCTNNRCVNGQCIPLTGGYRCQCNIGWGGNFCDQTTLCRSDSCLNGGTCNVIDNNQIKCTCNPGYYGSRCENYACEPNPCRNEGTCRVVNNGYQCDCRAGWVGANCETRETDLCQNNPCLNGGQCSVRNNAFFCTCPADYTGNRCQTRINFCTAGVCLNGGTCESLTNSFRCRCLSGFTGDRCETRLSSSCSPNPCRNGANCLDLGSNNYQCVCTGGWTGPLCEEAIDYCAGDPCYYGDCVSSSNGFQCNCFTGWTGNTCNIPLNFCVPNPCIAGTCRVQTDFVRYPKGFSCDCEAGWTGDCCHLPAVCNPNPCGHGHCFPYDRSPGYSCICYDGWSGGNCNVGVSGLCNPNPCFNGQCVLTPGQGIGYRCDCYSGYSGSLCDRALRTACSPNPCLNNGNCGVVGNGYRCTCPTGFTGTNCEFAIRSYCSPNPCWNGRCEYVNPTAGGGTDYRCACNPGYSGTHCQFFSSACINNPCKNGGSCRSSGNSYQCLCTTGWGGRTCEDRITNICSPSPCRNDGQCIVDGSSTVCICRTGWYGNTCERRDYCSSSPCLNDGSCSNTDTSFRCTCRTDYIGDRCETPRNDVCSPGRNPCQQGTCIKNNNGEASCRCNTGWTGATCDRRVQLCPMFASLCKNGATCRESVEPGRIECQCTPGWRGGYCDERINSNACTNFPCANSGVCRIDSVTLRPYCQCSGGWRGTYCNETSGDACSTQPCLNNGRCSLISTSPGYRCDCVAPWTGSRCQTQNYCSGINCNNGNCRNLNSNFECVCNSGWTGSRCDIRVSGPCSNSPCRNNGNCIVVGNSYRCECQAGWTGRDCIDRINACSSSPCRNEGTCRTLFDGSYSCDCRSGYIGMNCEIFAPCESRPCRNGGTCFVDGQTFRCRCLSGFTGSLCETTTNQGPCNPNPCQNGGQCFVDSGSNTARCSCVDRRWTGSTCTQNICSVSNPCVRGTCVPQVNTDPTCDCPSGYTGDRCQTLISSNLCSPNPCQNSGVCSISGNTFSCDCRDRRFGGSRCDTDICQLNPCTSGTCVPDSTRGATCVQGGCSNNPCLNGGKCLTTNFAGAEFVCDCPGDWEGSRCERRVSYTGRCTADLCRNNGRCSNLASGDYRCYCQVGYYGTNCGSTFAPGGSTCEDRRGRAFCIFVRDSDNIKFCDDDRRRSEALDLCKFTCNLCGINAAAAKEGKDD